MTPSCIFGRFLKLIRVLDPVFRLVAMLNVIGISVEVEWCGTPSRDDRSCLEKLSKMVVG